MATPGWPRNAYNNLANTPSGGLLKIHDTNLANQEQFLDFYPVLKELIERHDELIANIYESAGKLEEEVRNSPKLRAVRKKTLSRKSPQRLREIHPEYSEHYPTDKDLIGHIFGYHDEQKHLEIMYV